MLYRLFFMTTGALRVAYFAKLVQIWPETLNSAQALRQVEVHFHPYWFQYIWNYFFHPVTCFLQIYFLPHHLCIFFYFVTLYLGHSKFGQFNGPSFLVCPFHSSYTYLDSQRAIHCDFCVFGCGIRDKAYTIGCFNVVVFKKGNYIILIV